MDIATSRHQSDVIASLGEMRRLEIFSSIMAVLTVSVAFGFFETNSMSNASVSNLIILDHFSIWHVAMGTTVFFIGLSTMSYSMYKRNIGAALLVAVADVLLFSVAEDIAWYVLRSEWVSYGDWSTWYIGGIYVRSTFVPWTYIILVVSAALLYATSYVVTPRRFGKRSKGENFDSASSF